MPHPAKWKCAELRSLYQRRLAGERTADLAAEKGGAGNSLRLAWKRLGLDTSVFRQKKAPRWVRQDEFGADVHALRVGGMTWEQIAERIGWSGTLRALRFREGRWRRRTKTPPAPRITEQYRAQIGAKARARHAARRTQQET